MSAPLAARTPTESIKSEKASVAARDPLLQPTEKVDAAATKYPTLAQPKNTTTKISNPFKKLCAVFKTTSSNSECDHELKLNSNALRAQIISNALVIATMACVHADYSGEVLKVDDPALHILTTNEGDKVQAAVVYYQFVPQQHSKVATVFKGALSGSDVEALWSLYKESKRVALSWKVTLEGRGLWSVG